MIRQYLQTLERPPGLNDKAFKYFLRRASAYFVKGDQLWRRDENGQHKLVVPFKDRLKIVRQAHDELGHKGYFSTSRLLTTRFYWPALHTDVRWYVETCHECQTRKVEKVVIPPTIVPPAPLFHKAYIDTMYMEKHGGYIAIVQARCSLTNWVEARMIRKETAETLGRFVFEDILSRWGGLAEIVTDNGTPFTKAVGWLSKRYGINHIRISPYNSRANGIVERSHRTLRDSLVKACGDNLTQWPRLFAHVLWADRVTIRKSTGMSPFYMAHGVEPLLPFDITEATFLVPPLDAPLGHEELVAIRARQLQKRDSDLKLIHDHVLAARFRSIQQFERDHAHTMHDFDFTPGSMVLVRNAHLDSEIGNKCRPRYTGPMVVVRRTKGGAYILAELTGAVSRLRYAAFRLMPYHARTQVSVPVSDFVDTTNIPEDDSDDSDAPDAPDELGDVAASIS
jgi:transposase InsO family protein